MFETFESRVITIERAEEHSRIRAYKTLCDCHSTPRDMIWSAMVQKWRFKEHNMDVWNDNGVVIYLATDKAFRGEYDDEKRFLDIFNGEELPPI